MLISYLIITMPHVNYFQRLGLEETFTRLFHVFGERWGVFLSITILAYIVIWAFTLASMSFLVPLFISSNNDNGGNYAMLYVNVFSVMLFDSAIYYAIMCIADGAIIRAVAEIYVDRTPNVHDTLQQGLQKLGPLFCTALIIGIALGIPIVYLVCGFVLAPAELFPVFVILSLLVGCVMIWVAVVTYHVYPCIMMESQGTFGSISRSFELSSGHRCYIFTTMLVFFGAKFLLSSIIKAIGKSGNYGAVLVAETLGIILNVFFASFGSM